MAWFPLDGEPIHIECFQDPNMLDQLHARKYVLAHQPEVQPRSRKPVMLVLCSKVLRPLIRELVMPMFCPTSS